MKRKKTMNLRRINLTYAKVNMIVMFFLPKKKRAWLLCPWCGCKEKGHSFAF